MKSTKAETHYTEHPQKHQGRCRDCTMFQPPLTCSAVQGVIKQDAHCDLFERKASTK